MAKTPLPVMPIRLEDCDAVMSREQVAAFYKFTSIRALMRRVHARRFPAPALSGPARWYRDDLIAWKQSGQIQKSKSRGALHSIGRTA
jgi:hypothetical protein